LNAHALIWDGKASLGPAHTSTQTGTPAHTQCHALHAARWQRQPATGLAC
jgi:hypothetical protein